MNYTSALSTPLSFYEYYHVYFSVFLLIIQYQVDEGDDGVEEADVLESLYKIIPTAEIE